MSFQDNLKTTRENAGYNSAKEFAETLGISYPTYLGYESKGAEPKYELLCKIAEKLGTSPNELIGFQATKDEYSLSKIRLKEAGFDVYENTDGHILIYGTAASVDDKNVKALYKSIGSKPLEFPTKEIFIRIVRSALEAHAENQQKYFRYSFITQFLLWLASQHTKNGQDGRNS